MSSGTLSVILYTRNLARRTSTTLKEILAQSLTPLDVLVVDDASNDETVEVVQELQRRHSSIRLIRHREQVGRIMSLNHALSIAEGDYIYIADVDGQLSARFFEKAIDILSRHPRTGFCYCDARPVGLEACQRRGRRAAWSSTPCYFEPAAVAEAFSGCHLSASMAVFDRRILVENHGIACELNAFAEWFALVTLGLRNGACYIPETLTISSPRDAVPPPASKRDKALAHLLRLMRSDTYLDLLGLMIGADLVSGLRPQIEGVVEGDPEHWEAESLLLIGYPLDLATTKHRARVLFERGRVAAAAGRLIEAQNIFADAVREFPNLHAARLLVARIAIIRSDYETAIRNLEAVESLAPDDPEVQLQWSKIHYEKRDYEKAEKALRRALALDPGNLAVILSLAETVQLLGREKEAASYYNENLAKHPDNWELLNAVGRLALKLGQTGSARIAFEQALSVNPECGEAKLALISLRAKEETIDPSGRRQRREDVTMGGSPPWEAGRPVTIQVPSAMAFHFVVAVWGESYTRLFLDVVLPSQMTPGNLEAFRDHPRCTYKIYTSAADAASIRQAKAYANLEDIVPTEIITMEDLDVGDKHASMSACHRHAVAAATDVGAVLLMLCPDSVFSEGTLARSAMLAGAGKRAVMLPGLRTVKETFAPALVGQIRRTQSAGWRLPSSRDLVKLAMQHLHPVTAQHLWNAHSFTGFPAFLLWEVPGNGWLGRFFHLHPLMMNPVRRHVLPDGTIDGKYVDSAFPDPRDVYVVEDSDEMVQIEMSTAARTVPRTEANRANVLAVVRCANVCAMPLHRAMLQRRVFIHAADIGPEWEDTVKASDHIVDSIDFFFRGLEVDGPNMAS